MESKREDDENVKEKGMFVHVGDGLNGGSDGITEGKEKRKKKSRWERKAKESIGARSGVRVAEFGGRISWDGT